MVEIIQILIPFGILVSHALLVLVFFALLARRTWGRAIVEWVGQRAIPLGFFVALASVAGSLFYSELVGFAPCVLCWWQRVFLYPEAILFGIALWKRKRDVFSYAVPLALFSGVIAAYQESVYLGAKSFLPCTALGGACSKIYVMAFGYITIPMMSLTAALLILLLAWSHKVYENHHA